MRTSTKKCTRRVTLPLAALLVLAACSTGGTSDAVEPAPEPTTTELEPQPAEPADDLVALPVRDGPRRETTGGVPHVQIGAAPVPDVDAELRRRAFELPGVEDRESVRSLPGARGLSLADDVELARPEVIGGTREFAHIHPDGSLHIWLPVERAAEVDRTKWGELHPWVERDGFWDGVVMVFTPETPEELDVAMRLVVDAYNFVTGAGLDPLDFA